VLANATVGILVIAIMATVGALIRVRRRHSWSVVAVIATPLVMAALLALLLEVDLLLPPLR
jgi:hypothetical protein